MNKKFPYILIFVWLSIFEASAALIYLLIIPTDPKNAWLFGFSRSRVILILSFIIILAALIWLGIAIWRKTNFAEQIQSKFFVFDGKRGLLWGLLVLLILVIVSGCLFLIQWNFLLSDQQIKAYLQRLTPVVLFGVVFCTQGMIIVWRLFLKNELDTFYFIMLIIGGFILFQWVLVAEFILSDKMFPEFYVAERYGEIFNKWMPVILFQFALFLQVPYLFKQRLNLTLNYAWLGFVVAITLTYFYYNAAIIHAQEVNNDLQRSDQDVYVDFTRKVSESNYSYSGVRNQTPGYPYSQAFFCHADLTDQELFMCGKRVNITLSVVFLVILFIVFGRFLPAYSSFTLLLIITSSLFIFKAGYMTVELTFYFFNFLSFLLMSIMLIRPSIKLGVLTGLILGITHLLKASVLPGIALFFIVFLGQLGMVLFKNKSEDINIKTSFSSLLVSIFCFFLIIFPYIHQSKEIYGQYFYNVNSTFYIWYDSWEEAKQGEINHAFTKGWPDLPSNQLPSPSKYIQDHTIFQIILRLSQGFRNQISHAINQYNAINYLLLYSILTSGLILISREQVKKLVNKFVPLIFFILLYLLGYILLFAWYFPIAGGPRFFAGLYIPMMFSIFMILNTLKNGRFIRLANFRIDRTWLFDLMNIVVVAFLISDIYIVITKLLPNGYFGS